MNKELMRRYLSTKATCCKCGATLEDWTGQGLGSEFVLDKDGKFYCMNCDKEFEEGDERIYELDLDIGLEAERRKTRDEVLIDLLNDRCDMYGVIYTIQYLLDMGCSDEDLVDLGFDEGEIATAREGYKKEGV